MAMASFSSSSKRNCGMVTGLLVFWLALLAADGTSVCEVWGTGPAGNLKVSAFNIKIFGVTKMGKPQVVDKLVQILTKYDLVLIQEIRDISGMAINDLLNEVNAANAMDPFYMELSARLGRTSAKEQYAFFYRPSKVQVMRTHQWPDTNDIFEREPFIVHFRAPGYAVGDFAFMAIHVKPTDAVAENKALADVYDGMQSLWGLQNFIIGGDLNAGCSYVSQSEFNNIRLWTESRFNVVIGHDADTTVYTSECPYDRFVLAGSYLQSTYVSGSASVYRFDTDLGLTQAEAKNVSDHFPIELQLS